MHQSLLKRWYLIGHEPDARDAKKILHVVGKPFELLSSCYFISFRALPGQLQVLVVGNSHTM